jgi:hypothetical protein
MRQSVNSLICKFGVPQPHLKSGKTTQQFTCILGVRLKVASQARGSIISRKDLIGSFFICIYCLSKKEKSISKKLMTVNCFHLQYYTKESGQLLIKFSFFEGLNFIN